MTFSKVYEPLVGLLKNSTASRALVTLLFVAEAASVGLAQQAPQTKLWAARPNPLPHYSGVNRPLTRLSDLKSRHANERRWREIAFADEHLHGAYISSLPGDRVTPRFHPDTRIYWVIVEGRIRFDIEGQAPVIASKGSMVQALKQTIYSIETIGESPSVRLEVTIPGATTVYVQDSAPPARGGIEWLPVLAAARKPAPYDHGNQPHSNLFDLMKDPAYGDTFFVDGDNEIAHIVCAYPKDKAPIAPGDRGHYHAEGAEVFINLAGQNRLVIEGEGIVTASAPGDIVYVPRYVFHNPRPYGPDRSCRLVLSAYREPLIQFRDPPATPGLVK